MRRTRRFTAAVGATAVVAGMTIAGASGVAGASSRPADTTLRGSVAPFTATSRVIGNLPASTKLSVQVWLRPRTAAAERYATAVSTPGSRLFHHYLSPAAYTARFAATAAQARKVAAWLRSQGFTSVHADAGRSYVSARARPGGPRPPSAPSSGSTGPPAGQRRPVRAARQRHVDQDPVLAGQQRPRRDRPGQRRAEAPAGQAGPPAGHPEGHGSLPEGQGAEVPVLGLLRAARGRRPAQPVRHHQVPDPAVRLHRRAVPVGLRGQQCQHRQGPDHRAGGAGPDPGHVHDPEGLRGDRRAARAEPRALLRAVTGPGHRVR